MSYGNAIAHRFSRSIGQITGPKKSRASSWPTSQDILRPGTWFQALDGAASFARTRAEAQKRRRCHLHHSPRKRRDGGLGDLWQERISCVRLQRSLAIPMNEQELEARDAGRDVGAELLQSMRDVKAGNIGRVNVVKITAAAEARQRLGLSQAQFAGMLGISVRTYQDWEQGRREPSGAAKTLLRVAAIRPEAVHEAMTSNM